MIKVKAAGAMTGVEKSHDAKAREAKWRAACFLDRDGTLTEERSYARTPEEIVLLPGAAEAVKLLNLAGVAAVVITNQSGVGRGLFSLEDLEAQHERLRELLRGGGASLDGIYACPHAPEARCDCRKPGTALLSRAAADLGLDLTRSWVIGDREEDVEVGVRGARGGILVTTGYGEDTLRRLGPGGVPRDLVFGDVRSAVSYLLNSVWGSPASDAGSG